MLSISEQYEHPIWQEMATRIKIRDGFTCQICGRDFRSRPRRIDAHHIYRAKGRHLWDYDDSELITLCIDCHEIADEPAMKKLAGIIIIAALKNRIDVIKLINTIENGKAVH
jgi:5-methylcytosine-specific restriction endonuclease McrA